MTSMDLQHFLDHVHRGEPVVGGSVEHRFMHDAAQQAFRITAEINTGHRTADEVRALLAKLTGKAVDESVVVFPPFYTEFGKNLTLGRGVFINLGCRFQDTGGITIGDDTLIGHGCTLTTLNHSVDPARRADMVPAPIRIGRQAWLERGRHGRPRSHHRRRCDRGGGRRRHPGRAGQHHRRRRPGEARPRDGLRGWARPVGTATALTLRARPGGDSGERMGSAKPPRH